MALTPEERQAHFATLTNSETIEDRALAIEALIADVEELVVQNTENESLLEKATKGYAESQAVVRSLLQSIPNDPEETKKPEPEEPKIRGFASLKQ